MADILLAVVLLGLIGMMILLAWMIDRGRSREREHMRKICELHDEIMRLYRDR